MTSIQGTITQAELSRFPHCRNWGFRKQEYSKNKKQVDIVKDTGISKGAFSSYLSGQYNPKADKMELIADSLDVDLRWLYGQNVPMEHTSKNNNALQCNMSFITTPAPSIFLII